MLDTAFISGIKAVEYEFNSTVPDVVARDVEITNFGSSALAAVLRFENISGGGDQFLFSANGGEVILPMLESRSIFKVTP